MLGVGLYPPFFQNSDFHTLLDNTQGIWTKGDGLEYQQKVRDEWS